MLSSEETRTSGTFGGRSTTNRLIPQHSGPPIGSRQIAPDKDVSYNFLPRPTSIGFHRTGIAAQRAQPVMQTKQETTFPWTKLGLLAFILAVVYVGYTQFGDFLSLDSLAERETMLREFGADHPVLIFVLAFAVYVSVTGFSLPGATILSLLYGWYFGFWAALPLVSFASTLGATLAFLMSRYLLRDTIQNRFGSKLRSFNDKLEQEGAFYLFTLRLIPAVPFFVINVVMGLTPIRTRTFWWVSQIGMLAGTAVYLLAGSSVPTLAELAEKGTAGIISAKLWLCFGLLGIFPLIVKFVMKRVRTT